MPEPTSPIVGDHRGGFGAFAGESSGLIDRTFRERIVLVGVTFPAEDEFDTERHLDELALLVDPAGADSIARVVQRRHSPDPATYLGSGKVEELRELCEAVDADTVVFDNELSPAQQRNLEKLLGRSAIDRTAVILDIFGQNAHSLEGKAQVELAQIRYRLPRLRGKGNQLSRQGGGIGARQGYTNAGKSTLLNHLTDAGVLVEDRLFATLDATTRRLQLPGGEAVLLTDTVGFITKLPTQLVEAFKSTLEVVVDADLLVHVIDGSAADPESNIEAVDRVLNEIGAADVPQMLVVNKIDVDPDGAKEVLEDHPGCVARTAKTGEGVADMLRALADRLRGLSNITELLVPFDRGDLLAALHREGEVLVETATEDGMLVRARLDEVSVSRLHEYVVSGQTLRSCPPDSHRRPIPTIGSMRSSRSRRRTRVG